MYSVDIPLRFPAGMWEQQAEASPGLKTTDQYKKKLKSQSREDRNLYVGHRKRRHIAFGIPKTDLISHKKTSGHKSTILNFN
jgi:hypothetical protein